MERFVQAITAGGVALVTGLWMTSVFAGRSPPRLLGVALVVVGVASLAWGIRREIDY